MAHTCHATGCPEEIPPELLMCRKHWFMVSWTLRKRIWETYRPGQESDDDVPISRGYCEAAKAAVIAAKREGVEPDTQLYDRLLGDLDAHS